MALGAILAAAEAQAQDQAVDFEIFRPAPDPYGYSAVEGAATLQNLQLGVGAWFSYEDDPVVLAYSQDLADPAERVSFTDGRDALVDNRALLSPHLGLGITRFGSLSVSLPILVGQMAWTQASLDDLATGVPDPTASQGIGDLQLTPKIVLIDRDYAPVGFAISVPVGIPTGSGVDYMGEGTVSAAPMLAFEWSDGRVHSRAYKFRFALDVGYLVREADRIHDAPVGSAILYGVGVAAHLLGPLEITAEAHGQSFGSRWAQNPSEGLLGAKLVLGRLVTVHVGAGMGFLPGVGAPDFRFVGGLNAAPNFDPAMRDTDRDGLVDGRDKCKDDAEDVDGYQDDDGCPDRDNDADGRPDDSDQCPDDPEDDDGYMDNDGCPDLDNDKDGVNDADDRCPNQAGPPDLGGCPTVDTDGDGASDDLDRCPYDAEDVDGWQDEDGCPDPDNDLDGVPDAVDKCPNEREVINGVDDEDGCPDQLVVVEASRIRINDIIYFDTGKATIQERSFALLDEIARVILEYPKLKKIRVEGHTDSVGNDVFNLKLSQARAESVAAYLRTHGVEAGRLDAAGFGEMRPIDSNDTDAGRSRNRRVEFIIVDQE
jgi:outer membrane protein OmpA-like peptidoglycan-associated protein